MGTQTKTRPEPKATPEVERARAWLTKMSRDGERYDSAEVEREENAKRSTTTLAVTSGTPGR